MTDVFAQWNEHDRETATAAILPCNGSHAWARGMVEARPLPTPEALLARADTTWRGLEVSDWLEAFASHPRIGESHAKVASAQSLHWSAGEQSAANADDAIKAALAEGNRLYEARFGRVFLVCATGRSAAEMLAILRARLNNDDGRELLEAAEQQRRITQLRLRKWLGLPAASCDTV